MKARTLTPPPGGARSLERRPSILKVMNGPPESPKFGSGTRPRSLDYTPLRRRLCRTQAVGVRVRVCDMSNRADVYEQTCTSSTDHTYTHVPAFGHTHAHDTHPSPPTHRDDIRKTCQASCADGGSAIQEGNVARPGAYQQDCLDEHEEGSWVALAATHSLAFGEMGTHSRKSALVHTLCTHT